MVLLVGIHPMCLLVTKLFLKSLQCARMCLLVTKVFLKSFKMRGHLNACHQMSPCLSTNYLLKEVATIKHNIEHQISNMKVHFIHLVLNVLRSWYPLLGFIQCACLLPKCPLKAYNVLECVRL